MNQKLLYIEDDEGISELIAEIMEYEHYEVITDDGKSMFRILGENQIGLILMDQRLFWSTGSQLCMELKAKPETKDIPVIMMSSSPDIERIALSCGASGFIKKPFDLYDVIDTVGRYLPKV